MVEPTGRAAPPEDTGGSLEATRRRLSPRQAEVVGQLVRATDEEIEEVGYTGLTVRSVARRAGVAPATAYNYFSPALVDACTVALLSANPDVKHLRDRIGARIHQRLAAAVGPDTDPVVVRVLETTFSGSLLAAGMGHMPYADIPGLVTAAAELMLDGDPRPAGAVSVR